MTAVLDPTLPAATGTRERQSLPQQFVTYFKSGLDLRELRDTPYGLTPLMFIAAMGLVSGLSGPLLAIAGRDIIRDFDKNVEDLVATGAFFGVVMAVAALGIGWFADRHRRVPMLAAGFIIDGATGLAQANASSFGQFQGWGVAGRVGSGIGGTPLGSLASDYYPVRLRGKMAGFLSLIALVPTLFGPIIAALATGIVGWRTAYVITSLPLLVFAVIGLFVLKEPVRGYWERQIQGASEAVAAVEDEPPSFGEAWRSVIAVRTIRRSMMASIPASFAGPALGILGVVLMFDVYGLSPTQLALMGIPSVIAGVCGTIIGAGIADTLVTKNPRKILVISYSFSLISPVSLVLMSTTPPIWLLIVFQTVTAFGTSIPGPAVGAIQSQILPPTVRSQGFAILALAGIPGTVFGVVIANMVLNTFGAAQGHLVMAPLVLLSSIIGMTAAGFFESDRRNALKATMAKQEYFDLAVKGESKQLTCRGIDVEYDGVQVLFDVDFEVDTGEIVALLGTNGAGKSTLLRAICGQQVASGGSIYFEGRQISKMPPHEIAARGITLMPGGRGLFPSLTVRDNLMLGTWMSDDPASDQALMEEVFALFPGLVARLDTAAGQLSGGEQQQVSLAQALLTRPKVLMIDELSLGLAPAVVGQLVDIVKQIAGRGITVIVVEQSVNVALSLAERAVFMEKGEVRFDGPTPELMKRPDILRAVYVTGASGFTEVTARSTSTKREQALKTAPPILEVTGLSKAYGGVKAVDDVSFTVRDGEILGLIGPNGAGKTTLFELISGHQVPDAGSVRFQGVDITRWSPERRAQAKLVRRFQDAKLFPSLTVYETLLVALEGKLEVRSSTMHAIASPGARRSERRIRQRADRLVELLELEAFRDKFVRELSTGLRRIVDLACTLALEPTLLLLDEPSTGVAQAEAEGLAPLLRQVQFETGCSIVIIEHDMPLISAVSDELLALELGRTVIRGTPSVVLSDERVITAYLGEAEEAIKRSGSLV